MIGLRYVRWLELIVENKIKAFERDDAIEYEIDRKIVIHYFNGNTVTMFMNILTESVNMYNSEGDNYSYNSLEYIIKLRRRVDRYDNIYGSPFSAREISYMKDIDSYIDYVSSLFHLPSLNITGLLDRLIYKVEREFKVKSNFHSACVSVKNELNMFKHMQFSLREKDCYLEFYIPKSNLRVCIIGADSAIDYIPRDVIVYALVLLCDVSSVFSALKFTPKINFIRCMDEKGQFYTIETSSYVDTLEIDVQTLLIKERGMLSDGGEKILSKLLEDIRKLQGELAATYRFLGEKNLHDLAVIKRRLCSALDYFSHAEHLYNEKITKKLKDLIKILEIIICGIKDKANIKESILFALSEIKRNNTLYILSKGNAKNYDSTYGEENLTSIVASNLRCLYKHNKLISVHCEAIVGNGRSDIKIEMAGREICLVEAKLIKEKSNVEDETRKAVDQLFARYSENNSLVGNNNVELYLILFSHDKDFRDLAKKIQNSLSIYAQRNNIEYKKVNQSECGFDFVYIERRGGLDILDKERRISVMVCNMEVEHKKNTAKRTANKTYNV